MKKIISGIILLFSLLSVHGEKSIKNFDFEKCCLNPCMNGQYSYSNPMGDCYSFPDFYMIGFSKDGKAAICLAEAVDGRGGVVINFRIQDLVTDEVLWEIQWDSFEYCNNDLDLYEKTFGSHKNENSVFVKENAAAIDKKLSEYKIISKKCDFHYLPSADDKLGIAFGVEIEDTGKKLYDMLPLKNYSVRAEKKGSGSKLLTEQKEVDCENVHVCGYFVSPFENRICLVIGEEHFIFEGTGLRYRIFGCDLNKGFD